jgi:hypothetical protein
MLAQHPITGKPIRVLKTETHLYKNHTTVVWLRPTTSTTSRYSRWSTLTTSLEDTLKWKETLNQYPSAMILLENTEEMRTWLIKDAPRHTQLIFTTKAVLETLGVDTLQSLNFANLLAIEEMYHVYPHIQTELSATTHLHEIVLAVSVILRANRVVGLTSQEQKSTLAETYNDLYKLKLIEEAIPEPLVYITQYYEPAKARRGRELLHCLKKNLECPYIDRVILLNETDLTTKLPKSAKLEQVVLGSRLQYKHVFEYIYKELSPDTLVVFANADIHLTNSWQKLWSVDISSTFLSLLRYEQSEDDTKEPQLFGPRPDSQDTWVVSSTAVQSRQWKWDTLAFEFGRAGCDNAINMEMLRQKFLVANPCLSLQTIHCHRSEYRTYDPEDCIDKPFYMYLDPTGLHDLEPKKDLGSLKQPWDQASPMTLDVHAADDQQRKTFLKMAQRVDETLKLDSATILEPGRSDEELYKVDNGFCTSHGLVYTYKSILMGSQEEMREAWAEENISHMTPCIGVDAVVGPPLMQTTAEDPIAYLLNYISRIFRLNEKGIHGHFWLPRQEAHQNWLQLFKWPTETMPVLPCDENAVAFGKHCYFFGARVPEQIYKEDIEALRTRLYDYQVQPLPNVRRAVICQDDVLLTSQVVSGLEAALEEQGYEVDIVFPKRGNPSFVAESMVGATLCITGPGCHGLFWLLPKQIKVIECLSETKITTDGLRMAAASSLEYNVVLAPRAKPDALVKILLERIEGCLAAKPIQSQQQKQVLILPQEEAFKGFHSHSGDSFREMARIWAERGYVELHRSSKTPFCWLGGIGQTLLYDRANYDWLDHEKPAYKLLLAGNPDASLKPNAKQWNFWPRRPEFVEKLAEELSAVPYEKRSKNLVFYGKVENSVQGKARKIADTVAKACDEFDMPVGTTQRYKYSQEEYLKAIADSKYGLCMAGYGPKCNREIELMAVGTVPVIAPDVDMDHYANPPKENIHYIRMYTTDPAAIQKQLSEISAETWQQMSAAAHRWWQDNASADGLWRTTKELVAQQ